MLLLRLSGSGATGSPGITHSPSVLCASTIVWLLEGLDYWVSPLNMTRKMCFHATFAIYFTIGTSQKLRWECKKKILPIFEIFFFQNCCVSISLLLHNLYFVHVWAQISAHDWLVEVINLITFCLAYHSLSDFNCHLSHGINIGFCICPCCLCYQFISAYHFCRLFMWAWPWLVDKDWESRGDCNVFWMFAHTRYRRSWVTRNCQ